MADRVEGIRAKLERAKKHISELESEVNTFLNSKPYKVAAQGHMQLPHATSFCVESAKPIPISIPVITGDVFQNLRSTLDHLAWQLVEASGEVPGKGTGFPIFDHSDFKTEKDITKFFERKVKGMREVIKEAIKAVHPYKGGNDALWAIHDINITDKHRLLITVGFSAPAWNISENPQFEAWFPLSGFYPLEVGEVIVTVPRKIESNEYPEFRFDVVLGEDGTFQGKPLLVALSTMTDVVENLISDFAPFLL